MHEYYTDFFNSTSCLVSNIGDAELKTHAYEQQGLRVPFVQGLGVQKAVSTTLLNKVKVEAKEDPIMKQDLGGNCWS
jgi:hypothetical protein